MNLELNFRKTELVFDVFLFALGALLFQQSAVAKVTVEEPLNASVYGMIISGLFLVALLVRFIKLLKDKQAGEEQTVVRHAPLILFAAVFALVYTICIIKVGYYVSTLVYTTVMITILREKEERTAKNLILTVVGCLAFTVVLYFIFKTFKVYLPNAWLI